MGSQCRAATLTFPKLQLRLHSTLPRRGQVIPCVQGVGSPAHSFRNTSCLLAILLLINTSTQRQGGEDLPSVNMTNDVLSLCATVDPLPTGRADSAHTTTSLSGGQPEDGLAGPRGSLGLPRHPQEMLSSDQPRRGCGAGTVSPSELTTQRH